jgi:Trk-type K+ transport system membrane component
MQVLTVGLVVLYVVMMPILWLNWYRLYQQESDMSDTERQISRVVLTLATTLWPIVLPLSYLELLAKVRRYEQIMVAPANRMTPEMP